ncbi:DDE-type integrase/transposase/recombinase [Novosphingobium sp. G106]|nr:DDE-type integrase/transposase/recombinase [Novosphingobium sp. G106]
MRDTVRALRPAGGGSPFAVRFETPQGQQAQVDFAQFRVRFTSAPNSVQIVWLFSMVLGFSRLIWGRFAQRQTMQTVLACHRAAFEAIGGVPREIPYDRMKTAVLGEDEDGRIIYNRTLGEFPRHYGFLPKACRAYRPETSCGNTTSLEPGARTDRRCNHLWLGRLARYPRTANLGCPIAPKRTRKNVA